ncbi:hypothetical protein JNJ66_04120 [Candidatus Saccharibacteria bacterium]|nr:hypothetical protein [Candidatus Saccharibacteria bacterium]
MSGYTFQYEGRTFQYEGHTFWVVGDGLIEYKPSSAYIRGMLPPVYLQLHIVEVRLSEHRNDNFPAAGFYIDREIGLEAVVFHYRRYDNPMQGDEVRELLEASLRGHSLNRHESVSLTLPVLVLREWDLRLVATGPGALEDAHRAYRRLRSGQWQPTEPFIDVVPDDDKASQLLHRIGLEEDDDLLPVVTTHEV